MAKNSGHEHSGNATPAEQFARWLEQGPRLADAAGCYVEIKVRPSTRRDGPVLREGVGNV